MKNQLPGTSILFNFLSLIGLVLAILILFLILSLTISESFSRGVENTTVKECTTVGDAIDYAKSSNHSAEISIFYVEHTKENKIPNTSDLLWQRQLKSLIFIDNKILNDPELKFKGSLMAVFNSENCLIQKMVISVNKDSPFIREPYLIYKSQ